MVKKNHRDDYFALGGILLLVLGMVLLKTEVVSEGVFKALPYICIGFGCGIFGQGMGNIIGARALKNDPNRKKEIEIEQKDERNVTIANRAKAKAFDMMIFVFGALLVTFALMGVDLVVILLLAFTYLFIVFYSVYFRSKYEKEM
jgi:hypothetical protein